MTSTALPSLTVVVPVRDEVAAVERTLRLLRGAVESSPWTGAPIVVVDDGSVDGTAAVLDALATPLSLQVVHQAGSGRLAARASGLEVAGSDLALLVDARVHLHEGALAHVAEQMEADPEAVLWNGHVHVDSKGNPYAGFWSALTSLGWRRYFSNPRRTSFGLEDFDAYPKGTTMFLAPRDWLLEASVRSDSHFDTPHLVSDDTALIRALARRARIHLSPGFACTYRGRQSLRPFLRQGFYRGTTFVDGYLGRGGVVSRVLALAILSAPLLVVLGWRCPAASFVAAAGVVAALGLASIRAGASRADALALAGLAPVFLVVFVGGVVRGLLLAGRTRARRSATSR